MKTLFLSFALMALLVGCASYQSSSLAALSPDYVQKFSHVNDMEIGCKALSKEECYTFLDRDVISKGYCPIQLTFYNQSDKSYVFSRDQVSLPTVSPDFVAKTVHTSTVGRVIGYGVGGFFTGGILYIPAIVDGIMSFNANKSLDKDFDSKAKSTLVIPPKSFRKTLIFVPEASLSHVMEVSLIEQESGKTKTVELSTVR